MNPCAFGRFVALTESDAPELLERMSRDDLPVAGDRYGVKSRLIARPATQVVDLATAALRKLFQTVAVEFERLGAVVLTSRVAEPAEVAREAIERLGGGCRALGVERACSGFPAAVRVAVDVGRESGRPVAVVAAEIISRNINWEPAAGDLLDQRRARGQAAKLFADGAAAVIVGPQSHEFPHVIVDAWQGEVPDEQQLIQKLDVENSFDPWGNVRPGPTTCMSMPGRRGLWLVRRAPQVMADSVEQSVDHARTAGLLAGEAVAHVVPHQPNGLILDRLQQQFDAAGRGVKVWNCLRHSGNTVSASIPLAMSEIQDHLPSNSLVAMPSVGAGGPGYRPDVLSTGCILVRMGRRIRGERCAG